MRREKCESMKFSVICLLFLMSAYQTGAYRRYPYEYYHPEYDFIEEDHPVESGGNSLADYWKVFKETFQKSYKDITKPYVIEREVPVYVPVDRVRTVVKHHPVYIKPNRNPHLNRGRPRPHY